MFVLLYFHFLKRLSHIVRRETLDPVEALCPGKGDARGGLVVAKIKVPLFYHYPDMVVIVVVHQ